jgi:predicted permease
MRLLLEWLRRLRFLVLRDRYSRELEDEMRLHLELRERQLRDCGVPAAVARTEARRAFGSSIAVSERSRDAWGLGWLEHAAADARFAARRLRHRPGFSIATIAVAALGIGASTAVFSATDATLLRPLPFLRPSELVTLPEVSIPFDPGVPGHAPRHDFVDITDVAAMHDVFGSVVAYAAGGLNLADATNPQRVRAGVVTTGFFRTLGVRPQAGRDFAAEEGASGASHVVLLSDALWRGRFARADMIGKSIELSGVRYTVVGVMEPGVTFPSESDLWTPLPIPTTMETFAPFRGFLPTRVIARLAPGVTISTASARLFTRWQQLVRPNVEGTSRIASLLDGLRRDGSVRALRQELVGDTRRAFVLLSAATALLLLIACANVANLLLSDAAARRREVALRGVLGASRGRIVRQLLVESLLLAFAGAAVGVAVAPVVFGVLRAMTPTSLAGVASARLDIRVLSFAIATALVTGLVFGLWPALGAARMDAAETIKSGGLGATAARMGTTRRALVTMELALTVMLLVGAGLMLRSFERVMSQNLGMDPERVGTLELSFPRALRRADQLATLHAIEARLAADPGIQAAGVVNDLPLRGAGGISISIEVEGRAKPQSPDDMVFSRYLMASGGYFRALGIPLLRGRTFTASDDSVAPRVAVINQAMATKLWPGGNVLGSVFHLGPDPTPITVVGIVADVREAGLERDVASQMYFPIDWQTPSNLAVVARSSLPPSVLLARLTDAVHSVDPTQAVYNVRMMEDVIGNSVAPRRTNTTLIAIFGAIALALSAFGVYAVVSHSVTRRAREFGIRSALGATGVDIIALVGGEMLWTLVAGLVIGVGGAWALSRVMASLLYGIDAHDAATFALAPIVLVVTAIVATLVPARRATRVDPTEVMRAE